MSYFSNFLVDYYNSLQNRLCDQDLIDTCSGTKETTPTLSGTTVSGVSNITITNYDPNNFYACVVSSGTYTLTNDEIVWDLSGLSTNGTLAVFAADDGFVLSDPGMWYYYVTGNDAFTVLLLHADGDDLFKLGDGYGRFGGAGANHYASVLTDPVLEPSSISISAWYRGEKLNPANEAIVAKNTSTLGYLLDLDGNGNFRMVCDNTEAVSTTVAEQLVWYHVGGTFNSSNGEIKLYVNGVLEDTASGTLSSTGYMLCLGRRSYIQSFYVDGFMDDVAIYNDVLSPTEMLSIFNRGNSGLTNNITDNLIAYYPIDTDYDDYSTNSFDMTATGATTTHYSVPITIYEATNDVSTKKFGDSSVYFDGSSSYANANFITSDFEWDESSFVVDMWVSWDDSINFATQDVPVWSQGSSSYFMKLEWDNTVGVKWQSYWWGNASYDVSIEEGDTTPPPTDTWIHYAFVRDAPNDGFYVFENGTVIASGTSTAIIPDYVTGFRIGTMGGTSWFKGNIDEVRVSRGTTRGWTSNFTPPTSQYNPDNNTLFLWHCSGDTAMVSGTEGAHDVYFDSPSAGIQITSGNEGVFSTPVYYFGGTTHMTVPSSDDFSFGTQEFVVDFWVNILNKTAIRGFIQQADDSSNFWKVYWNQGATRLDFTSSNGGSGYSAYSDTWDPATQTWYHIAVVGTGSKIELYVDGQSIGSNTGLYNLPNITDDLNIGRISNNSKTVWYNHSGYIDELRISKGTNRGWTGSSFDVPTEPYS